MPDRGLILPGGADGALRDLGGGKAVERQHRNRLPIALTKAGAVHANGTLTVLAKSISGTPNLMSVLNWREIR